MNQKKIILVTGATSGQGKSVAKALLAGGTFSVRALTRNAQSAAAKELAQAGADIAEGDFDNPASLAKALEGVYGVFGVTNFWEHYEKEYEQGKNLADAVHAAGVKHFIYSSLADYHQLSNGQLPVAHFDIKATLKKYIQSLGIPASFTQLAFYYENFLNFFPLQKDAASDVFYFGFPQGDTRLSIVSVEDLGVIVATMFDHPVEYIGRTVGVVGEDLTCTEYAQILAKVLGVEVEYRYIPRDVYAGFGFPGAEELANMFEVQRLYIPNRWLDLIESHGLNPHMLRFEAWAAKNKAKLLQGIEQQLETVNS